MRKLEGIPAKIAGPSAGLRDPVCRGSGGRTWWAHFEFTRINIEPTILRKKFEERSDILASERFLATIDARSGRQTTTAVSEGR
jgi:hypothetical protein